MRNLHWFFRSSTVKRHFSCYTSSKWTKREELIWPKPLCSFKFTKQLLSLSSRKTWVTWRGTDTQTSRSTDHTTEISRAAVKPGRTAHILTAMQLVRSVSHGFQIFPKRSYKSECEAFCFWKLNQPKHAVAVSSHPPSTACNL